MSALPLLENHRKYLIQLISREQNYVSALHFGMERFVHPLSEKPELITPNDHRTLFQNIDELLRISEDILEQLCQDDSEPQLNFVSRVYLSKTTTLCAAYKKYCNGIKRADCVLVNKTRQTGTEFISFITEPQVPRKKPDLTMYIHRPLQHFREILKLMQLLSSHCQVDSEEQRNFNSVIKELQGAYREITVNSGLMEPLGEGRPLLTLQDLESRMVFTKCKPFTLATPGRQWVFGGDLSRVEGRSVKPYWTLLFSDIIVFAKVSRDRVLFITEEPISIVNIVDSCFNMRKKTTEFRLTVDPNGRSAQSPTGYCAPDLTRTPKKGARRKNLILRAPSLELKAVWQNLLQRQIFLVNATFGQTPLSSPLDSPDIFNNLVPLSDVGLTTTSAGSIKILSLDNINPKTQQNNDLSKSAQRIEMLIDEKCRILNKTGTPKSSALHLANWMKGQLDKQQEKARLAASTALRNNHSLPPEDNNLLLYENDHDEKITFWTRQQLESRTKELNLLKDNGLLSAKPNFGGKRLSGVEELAMSDVYSENKSQKSQSRSTTSDSQITVRSSPIGLDQMAVCRHCHRHCQQTQTNHVNSSHHKDMDTLPLVDCETIRRPTNASSTLTNSHHDVLVCNSLKVQHKQSSLIHSCNANDYQHQQHSISRKSVLTSNINDEDGSLQSSTVDASFVKNLNNAIDKNNIGLIISNNFSKPDSPIQNILKSSQTNNELEAKPDNLQTCDDIYSNQENFRNENFKENNENVTSILEPPTKELVTIYSSVDKVKFKQTASPIETNNNEKIKEEQCVTVRIKQKTINTKPTLDFRESISNHCNRDPEKLDSPKQTPSKSPNKNCNCNCNKDSNAKSNADDKSLSLTLTDDLLALKTSTNTEPNTCTNDDKFLPTIAVVPPTPDVLLTKTCTNLWDNTVRSFTPKFHLNSSPAQAVVENIPDDSCDESPLEEEPPYRSMNNLRRFGTMSSLEILPPDGRSENEDIDDLNMDTLNDDFEDDDFDDNARADQVERQKSDDHSESSEIWSSKMSFFEESKAFIDKYLVKWSQEPLGKAKRQQPNSETDDQMDECTSGATSGEEIWGTPTSGGDNDELNLVNSENTHSSPTKSSTSLNDDDDTELMMDELLMAPPMTASSIRGLLPRFYRRRLEPLFEEETESDEEKAQQESEGVTKGEATTNGNFLEDSAGKPNDSKTSETIMTVERESEVFIPKAIVNLNPQYGQEQKEPLPTTPTNPTSNIGNYPSIPVTALINQITANSFHQLDSARKDEENDRKTPKCTTQQLQKRTMNQGETGSKPVPPPPPPRRLILTQTNLKTDTNFKERGKQSGGIADSICSVAASAGTTSNDTNTKQEEEYQTTQKNSTNFSMLNASSPRSSTKTTPSNQNKSVVEMPRNGAKTQLSTSTIIETCLLGSAAIKSSSSSPSKTASTDKLVETKTSHCSVKEEEVKKEKPSPNGTQAYIGSVLSPRLEMRLALNHNIMGDEDLISYVPGPDLAKILGRDLSTYQRRTGRELQNRSLMSPSRREETGISCSQQRNSKMDTPTVHRRPSPKVIENPIKSLSNPSQISGIGLARVGEAPQHPQPNRNTWSSSAFVAGQAVPGDESIDRSNRSYSCSSEDSKLSDLEILARREKIYCMSRLKNGSAVQMRTTVLKTKLNHNRLSKESYSIEIKEDTLRASQTDKRKIGKEENSFIKPNNCKLTESPSEASDAAQKSNVTKPDVSQSIKDIEKSSLNRRLWKHITKRRRSTSNSK